MVVQKMTEHRRERELETTEEFPVNKANQGQLNEYILLIMKKKSYRKIEKERLHANVINYHYYRLKHRQWKPKKSKSIKLKFDDVKLISKTWRNFSVTGLKFERKREMGRDQYINAKCLRVQTILVKWT